MKKEYDDAVATSNQEMVNGKRIAHCCSRTCTGVALSHQQTCLIMSPTKDEPHPLDPTDDKLHSAVSNLLTTLVWKFSLLICLFLAFLNAKRFGETSLIFRSSTQPLSLEPTERLPQGSCSPYAG